MYFPDDKTLEETLEEMKRVLKPNGTIFIGENISSSGYPWELTWFQDLSPIFQNRTFLFFYCCRLIKKSTRLLPLYFLPNNRVLTVNVAALDSSIFAMLAKHLEIKSGEISLYINFHLPASFEFFSASHLRILIYGLVRI